MLVESTHRQSSNLISESAHHKGWQIASLFLFAVAALAIAYQPVMFNFFTSDDFYIIAWLHSVKHNPLLLFQGVYEGTPYYRPLINLVWFAEYLLCGTNSCLFRVIAIVYKLVSAVVLGLVLSELSPVSKGQNKTPTSFAWSIFSAGLFLLYPLHTEPINWFVSTTEVLVNLFILTSFLFYLRWRRQKESLLAVLSCAFAVCAFLTKETAVIIPLILIAYELLPNNPILSPVASSAINYLNRRLRFFAGSIFTTPYWLLLGGYLFMRKQMTGEFLGSWNNTVFHFTNNQTMFKAWLQSLKMIVMPLSSAEFNHNYIAYSLWLLTVVSLVALTIRSMWKDHQRLLLGTFTVVWFLISLLPMLKLLWITPDLLNARYGYIASVPLCAFLMFGLAKTEKNKLANDGRYVLFFLVLILSTIILRNNNSAWAETGQLTNNMRSDFARIHTEIAGDPQIYFFNMPAQYKGVPIAGIKTIQSMNHIPFSAQNFDNGFWFLDNGQLPLAGNEKNANSYFLPLEYTW